MDSVRKTHTPLRSHVPTTFRFTGQREQEELGLYFYQSRWYDAALARFIQPDTIIPDPYDSQARDRYHYAGNNPLRFVDPTGHWYYDPGCDCLVDNKEPEFQYKDNLTYKVDKFGLFWLNKFAKSMGTNDISVITSSYSPEVSSNAVSLGFISQSTQPMATSAEEASYLDFFAEFGNQAFTFVTTQLSSEDAAYRAYRHLKGIPTLGPVEAGVGAGLQVISDLDNDLTLEQRVFRGGAIFIEELATDYVSYYAGMAGGAVGTFTAGGPGAGTAIGYFTGAMAANEFMEFYIWQPLNERLWTVWGLGIP